MQATFVCFLYSPQTLAALGVPGNGTDAQGNHVDDIIGLFMLGEKYKRP